MSDRKRKDRKLSLLLKLKLMDLAPMEYQDQDALAAGEPGKLVGEVITDHIAKEAMKGERWAIELAYDRAEGKPIQAVKDDASDRSVEERLDDVTRHHLNELARSLGAGGGNPATERADSIDDRAEDRGGDARDTEAVDDSAGATPGLLDLPRDGDSDSEEFEDES